MEIRKRLEKEADEKYQKFSASLIPNINNVLGVRVPVLRKIAKELYKTGEYSEFFNALAKYMEENLLKGMIIGLMKAPIEKVLPFVRDFVPLIDNWEVCDNFCSGLKVVEEDLELFWNFVQPYFSSKNEYDIRFAYVMLLNYYVIDDYIDKIFMIVDEFKDDRYYAKMAVAWLLSICYVKYPQKTEKYLKNSKLDDWTFNKSIQKICESLRVDKETKNNLKKLKRF